MDFKEIFGEELAPQIESIANEKGLNLIVDNKEKPAYIPKDRFNEVINSKNELKTQVSELTNHLEEMKKSAKGNDELTKTIEELQAKNTEWSSKYNRKILEDAIKFKALQEKARDISDMTKFVDMDSLEMQEDGSIKGLDEQIAGLKESKSYLFESEKQPENNAPLNPGSGTNILSEKEKYNALLAKAVANPNNKELQHQLFIQKTKLN